MTDEHLMKLMKQVDPLTVRIPPGVRAIANAIEAEERERWEKDAKRYRWLRARPEWLGWDSEFRATPWSERIMWVIAIVLLALTFTGAAHAGGVTYEPRPRTQAEDYPADSFNAWKLHLGYSAAIGTLTYAALPDLHWAAQGAICLLPGHIRENSRQHEAGNRYSERDMIVNAVGCAAGIALTHQVKVRFAPNWVGFGFKF